MIVRDTAATARQLAEGHYFRCPWDGCCCTKLSAIRGKEPRMTKPSWIPTSASYSPYCAWKWGGLRSRKYMRITIP
jgi:hypothetical protein